LTSIRVVPVGIIQRYVDGQETLSLEGQAGKSVRALLESLSIPSELVAAVLVNGRLVQKGYRVQDGDEIKLIPLLGGG
jgi:sulfur carrier protein ThiS